MHRDRDRERLIDTMDSQLPISFPKHDMKYREVISLRTECQAFHTLPAKATASNVHAQCTFMSYVKSKLTVGVQISELKFT